MSTHRPRRSLDRALTAIRAHFRETGRSPSLSDMARRLRCSRQRASVLAAELERRKLITRTAGEAFSIRLTQADPAAMISDDEIWHEAVSRGLVDAAQIGSALRAAYPVEPLTSLQLPGGASLGQLLVGLDGEVEAAGGEIGSTKIEAGTAGKTAGACGERATDGAAQGRGRRGPARRAA